MTENMRIWNAVATTNPHHTKKVEIGRKFTSIDAHYQILKATEVFGPVGQGWGYVVHHDTISAGPYLLAVADVVIWHGTRDNTFGPIRGMAEIVNAKGRLDDDAPKKATTDALTKALSHLGFSADVFLGLYDDNKYVAKMRQEHAGKEAPRDDKPANDTPPSERTVEPVEVISTEQVNELRAALDDAGISAKDFCQTAHIKTLIALPAAKFAGALGWITKQQEARNAAA